jgi:hypothetical protein
MTAALKVQRGILGGKTMAGWRVLQSPSPGVLSTSSAVEFTIRIRGEIGGWARIFEVFIAPIIISAAKIVKKALFRFMVDFSCLISTN